jgi:hypothetical protein
MPACIIAKKKEKARGMSDRNTINMCWKENMTITIAI